MSIGATVAALAGIIAFWVVGSVAWGFFDCTRRVEQQRRRAQRKDAP